MVVDSTVPFVLFCDQPITGNGPLATHQMSQTDFTSSTAGTTQGKFQTNLRGIILDETSWSWIWISDTANNRVQISNVPFSF